MTSVEIPADAICSICFEGNMPNPKKTPCNHWFCSPCIDKWLDEKKSEYKIACPVCKKNIAGMLGYRDPNSLFYDEPTLDSSIINGLSSHIDAAISYDDETGAFMVPRDSIYDLILNAPIRLSNDADSTVTTTASEIKTPLDDAAVDSANASPIMNRVSARVNASISYDDETGNFVTPSNSIYAAVMRASEHSERMLTAISLLTERLEEIKAKSDDSANASPIMNSVSAHVNASISYDNKTGNFVAPRDSIFAMMVAPSSSDRMLMAVALLMQRLEEIKAKSDASSLDNLRSGSSGASDNAINHTDLSTNTNTNAQSTSSDQTPINNQIDIPRTVAQVAQYLANADPEDKNIIEH